MKEQKNLAHIAINKSRVKEYDKPKWEYSKEENKYKRWEITERLRVVYLDNGTEFQLELFNPYHCTIGILISFNEKIINNQMIVLKPGERIWLDRYIDSPKKFLFSTYEVEDSKEAKEAISENGLVNIEFYKEKYHSETTTLKISNISWEPSTWETHYYSSGQYSIQQNLSHDYCDSPNNWITSECTPIQTSTSTIETGRIEEGSHSNQTFETVYNEFENYPFATEKIKILPTSRKLISKSDIQKIFCYNCGRKIKEKFKFCPFCGAKQ
ncbi:MAG: zinc ribbon domain-containing protein [Erysipelotrichales bacterium]|nr:zinc ribbon domain-containing protein [Erysipelotrichales bacterium]